MGPAPLALLAAALAGLTALAAEILWIRGVGRGTGASPEAFAAVAGLFLAGMGLGSAWAARRVARSRLPARAGAAMLLAMGTLVALSPFYLAQLGDLAVALLAVTGAPGGGGTLPAFLLTAPLVLPTAFAFGAAFPFFVRVRVRRMRHAAARTGALQAATTVGSVLGVVGAVLLLPVAGESAALRLAGVASLVAALLMLLGDRSVAGASEPAPADAPPRPALAGGQGVVLALSGAAALAAQLAWVRMLQPLAGAHLWGIALLWVPLLLALAVGAALGGRLADRVRRPDLLLAGTLLLAGVFTVLSLPLAGGLPRALLGTAGTSGALGVLAAGFAWTCGPAALAFGAALPIALRVDADRTRRADGPAGRLYAWNCLGALAGSAGAGFVLLPHLGAERTLVVAAALPVLVGAALRLRAPGRRRLAATGLHVLPLALLLWPGLLPALLAAAPAETEILAARKPLPPGLTLRDAEDLRLYATWFVGERARAPGDARAPVLPAFEGRAGRVVLIEEPDGHVGLRRGALRESVFDPDRADVPSPTELMLGLLPGLMHPTAERALVIGHGAGWTAEAGLATGVGHLDVAELDDAVLRAARAYRRLARLPVEADPRARVLEADGRVLLRRAAADETRRYDWIASQPSHPWSVTAGHLFTQEAYETARMALREGGILAQWLNVFDMSPELMRRALATFRAVFGQVWVFRLPGNLVLLGFRGQPHVQPQHWESLLHRDGPCAAMAQAAGFTDAGDVWKHFALDTAGVDRVIGTEAPALRDDRPALEFGLAWRRLTAAPDGEADRALLAGFPPDMGAALPDAHLRERWLAQAVRGWLRAGRPEEADQWARRLRWGMTTDAVAAQGMAALRVGNLARGESLLARASEMAPERSELVAEWIDALGASGLQSGDGARWLARVDEAAAGRADDGVVLAAAGRAHRLNGNVAGARAYFERAVRAVGREPPPGARTHLARMLLAEARGPEQERRAADLLANDAYVYEDVDALDLLVRLTSHAGNEPRAATLEAALQDLQRTVGLALLRRAAGDLARHAFADALRAARLCRGTWAQQPTTWELAGLTCLAALGAAGGDPARAGTDLAEAVELFRGAAERSETPARVRARAQRMLRWYGHDPELMMAVEDAAGE